MLSLIVSIPSTPYIGYVMLRSKSIKIIIEIEIIHIAHQFDMNTRAIRYFIATLVFFVGASEHI